MDNIWLYSYRIKGEKENIFTCISNTKRTSLHIFQVFSTSSEAHTASFVGTIHSAVEHNEISDPEADHMNDSLKQL